MKIALLILAIGVGLLTLLEVSLRLLFGFGRTLIYLPDEQIGYLLAPNQRTRRFGNRIDINEYSMRSPPISPTRPASTLRVLLLGDSVANGGWWTDREDTISAMMARELGGKGEEKGRGGEGERGRGGVVENAPIPLHVEVLNASANSWGPRNELAYLERFGTFDAQAVVLLINTDDLFATAPTSLPVGHDRNYPSRQPPFALLEVWSRYILPSPPVSPELQAVQAEPGDRVGRNLEAIQQISHIVNKKQGQLLLAMTPLLREIGQPGSLDYEKKARLRLKEFTQDEQITYLDFLPIFNAAQQPETFYRDHIHLSPAGNQKVSEIMSQALSRLLQQKQLEAKDESPSS